MHHVPEEEIWLTGVYPPSLFRGKMDLYKPIGSPPFSGACFSAASLHSVRTTRVIHDPHWHRCGIIIDYLNGAQQSVGQCRLGVDIVERTDSPACFFLAHSTYTREGTDVQLPAYRVSFRQRLGEPLPEGQTSLDLVWTRHSLVGTFELWFTEEKAKPNVYVI